MYKQNLIETLSKPGTLYRAWEQINRSNLQSKGIDGQTIREFDASSRSIIPEVAQQLREGRYTFSELRARPIEKGKKADGSTKWRPLQIPTVRDRVVQKALLNVIKPDLEKAFGISKKPNSYAYIKTRLSAPNKGVRAASDAVVAFYDKGNTWVFKGDIQGFFDEVNREKLLKQVYGALRDDSVNKLIETCLNVDIGNRQALIDYEGFGENELQELYPSLGTGIPQGGILSPTFSNIVLAPLDDAFITNKLNSVRYADDFMVLTHTKADAEQAHQLAKEVIEKLDLKLHDVSFSVSDQDKKSVIAPLHNIEFLGIKHKGKRRYPSSKAFAKMTAKLRAVDSETKPLAKKLYLLHSLSASWGSTYWFTSSNMPAEYRALNKELIAATARIFQSYGLRYSGEITPFRLGQLGVKLFNQSVDTAHSRKEEELSKNALIE